MSESLPARIFVSHAGLDWEDDVRPLCNGLGLDPLNSFIYHDDVKNSWAEEIEAQLADTTHEVVVLIFVSPNSVVNDNVADELRIAKHKGLTIVPVMITEVETEGTGFSLLLSGKKMIPGYKLSKQKTIEAIRAALPKPRPPAAAVMLSADLVRLTFVHPDRVQLGGDPKTERALPLDRLQRETLRHLVGRLRKGGLDRATRADVSKLIGMHLFDLALTTEWRDAIAAVARDGGRFELDFDPAREPNDIETWPWEYLYQWDEQSGEFVVEKAGGHVVRTLRSPPPRELPALAAELATSILLCVPRTDLKALDHHVLFEAIESGDPSSATGLRAGVTALTEHTTQAEADAPTEQRVTWRDFRTAIATRRPHLLHFVGAIQQGADGEMQLAFAHPNGDEPAAWAPLSAVARELNGKAHADSPVGIVVLSVYEQEGDERGSGGLRAARALATAGIPTVIALPYRSGDDTPDFLRCFYGLVLERKAGELNAEVVRTILASCRESHRDDNPDSALYPFGEPIVFLHEWKRAQAAPSMVNQQPRDPAGGVRG